MLKRIKIRSKILLLLAAPIAALGLFAASGALERFDTAEQSREEAALAELASATSDVALTTQIEQLRTVVDEGEFEADVATAREATDAAVATWWEALEKVRPIAGPELTQTLDTLAAELEGLDALRDRIDLVNLSSLIVIGDYAQLDNAVDAVGERLVRESEDPILFLTLDQQLNLSRSQRAMADIVTTGVIAVTSNEVDPGRLVIIRTANEVLSRELESYQTTADPANWDVLVQGMGPAMFSAVRAVQPIDEVVTFIERRDTANALSEWSALGESRLVALNEASKVVLDAAEEEISILADDNEAEAGRFVLLAAAVVGLTLFFAMVIGRSISRPLRRLTASAHGLAADELPALVDSFRSGAPQRGLDELSPIDTSGRDEVAKLAQSISDIQHMTVEVAEEQGVLLRRGISEIFVNLARRNQSLLDRQIDFIDELERQEENPDVLENLFRLDHLATRMRRNAESLLVLAGAEPPRRRGKPVALTDVARVAVGEVEDFHRVELLSVDPAAVAGAVAVDLAHLLSELMENASQFSPPDTAVEVVGHLTEDGGYLLSVSDRGIGMSEDQLASANELLATPPVVGLDLSRSLGFTVASRLASRLGVTVRLTPSPSGGVTAVVSLPSSLVIDVAGTEASAPSPSTPGPEAIQPAPSNGHAPAPTTPPVVATIDEAPIGAGDPLFDLGRTNADPEGSPMHQLAQMIDTVDSPSSTNQAPPAPPGALPQRRSTDSAPESPAPAPAMEQPAPPAPTPTPTSLGDLPQLPRRGALNGTSPAPTAKTPPARTEPSAPAPGHSDLFAPRESTDAPAANGSAPAQTQTPAPAPVQSRSAASVAAVDPSITSAGLIRRTPRSVNVPDSVRHDGSSPIPESPAGTPTRSPDEVRQMLSRYRAGLRKGRGPTQG